MAVIEWANLLAEENVEGLWTGLYSLISGHSGVRPLHFATDGAAVTSQMEINADLTQELFIELFQKQRFDHYVQNEYTSKDIENELANIEIPNLVGARLRKRYPESFRMARRVSALLKASDQFRRFGDHAGLAEEPQAAEKPRGRGRPAKKKPAAEPLVTTCAGEDDDDFDAIEDLAGEETREAVAAPKRRRMVNQLYGLRHWPPFKPAGDSGHFSEKVKSVPMRRRDTRIVGRSGSSQLIISNPELEQLIIEVLKAIDSPADVRTIRRLVLSKIPLQDYNVESIDEELAVGNHGAAVRRDPSDTRATPEDALLQEEQYGEVSRMAGDFLGSLRKAVNNNDRRYSRLLQTLWHCYYNPQGPSQIEIAKLLGISDSLVSDNRRLIEHELKKLKLSVEHGAVFSESLQRLIVQNMPVASVAVM